MCVSVFVFNVPPTAKVIWRQGHGLKFHQTDWKEMEPVTSGLEGEWFIHYTTTAPSKAGYYICKYSKTCLK